MYLNPKRAKRTPFLPLSLPSQHQHQPPPATSSPIEAAASPSDQDQSLPAHRQDPVEDSSPTEMKPSVHVVFPRRKRGQSIPTNRDAIGLDASSITSLFHLRQTEAAKHL
eukprot:760486-Hanusia_phi.AAC.2